MSGRGGKRPGAGRKKGVPNQRTKEREKALEVQAAKIKEALGENCFEGNAHDLMVAVYKDKSLDLPIRLDAAKAAAPYEKPKLQAIEHSGNIGDTPQEDWLGELDDEPQPKPARKR